MQGSLCPTCQNASLSIFFDRVGAPIHCNVLWSSRAAAVGATRGDMRLGFCHYCGMIYNTVFDPDLMTYTEDYENSLHGSPRFQHYAASLATHLVETYDLHGKTIIEIGCGQGEFLTLLCKAGHNHGVGFDPGYHTDPGTADDTSDMTFIRDEYSAAYLDYAADLICCRQVLEHIATPRTFLEHIRRATAQRPTSAAFFEVPNVLYTLREGGIWDLLYEHCSYFSAPSLTRLFQETGFAVRDVYPVFDGQFLCLETTPMMAADKRSTQASQELDQLARDVAVFGENYRHQIDMWHQKLSRLDQLGRRVVVWGAGTKGVMFLNTVKASEQVRYIVDINPRKQAMYIAGTGQQIVPPEFLQSYRPDVVLVMNPIYQDEIRACMTALGLSSKLITV